jgi:hypothetical protein
MKQALTFALTAALGVAATSALGADRHLDDSALIVTASNTASNQLMVYDTKGTLLSAIPTEGQGGVSGNAGGIASDRGRLAVVNFGSGSVSLFSYDLGHRTIRLDQVVQALGSPVSVALAHDHLYILTTTSVESHAFRPRGVAESADGAAALLHADGTAAQVGVVDDRLVLTEKSNAIETVRLNASGAINGTATLVTNIPANVNAPFGLATRGNDAYVTIAHANEVSLVRDGTVLTVTGSGTQKAPCWVALDGPFLFSANSPSQSASRYAVYGQKIVLDAEVVANFEGNPTDIAYRTGLAAVIDSDGTVSHVSVFAVDEDGNLALNGSATINNKATNGVQVLSSGN